MLTATKVKVILPVLIALAVVLGVASSASAYSVKRYWLPPSVAVKFTRVETTSVANGWPLAAVLIAGCTAAAGPAGGFACTAAAGTIIWKAQEAKRYGQCLQLKMYYPVTWVIPSRVSCFA
jgi:hypothetical protein